MKSKVYDIYIPTYDVPKFELIVRNHLDYITIILETINLILLDNKVDTKTKESANKDFYLGIKVNKMYRMFFCSSHKKFSVFFPFYIIKTTEGYQVNTNSGIEINFQILSELFTILNSKKSISNSIDLYELVLDDEISNNAFNVFDELIYCEPGYVRYDFDKKNFNEHKHPLYHFDINFSTSSTFKIGIYGNINNKKFMDHFDITTDASYLSYYDKKHINKKN